jgi:DNA transformation protein
VAAKADPHRFDDLFSEFGLVSLRRFFGGEGVFADGDVMIGMVFDGRIFFKTDEETIKAFKKEKCTPFSFEKGGETVVTSWYSLPERLYDDPEELAGWARDAFRVAASSQIAKKKARKLARMGRQRKSS